MNKLMKKMLLALRKDHMIYGTDYVIVDAEKADFLSHFCFRLLTMDDLKLEEGPYLSKYCPGGMFDYERFLSDIPFNPIDKKLSHMEMADFIVNSRNWITEAISHDREHLPPITNGQEDILEHITDRVKKYLDDAIKKKVKNKNKLSKTGYDELVASLVVEMTLYNAFMLGVGSMFDNTAIPQCVNALSYPAVAYTVELLKQLKLWELTDNEKLKDMPSMRAMFNYTENIIADINDLTNVDTDENTTALLNQYKFRFVHPHVVILMRSHAVVWDQFENEGRLTLYMVGATSYDSGGKLYPIMNLIVNLDDNGFATGIEPIDPEEFFNANTESDLADPYGSTCIMYNPPLYEYGYNSESYNINIFSKYIGICLASGIGDVFGVGDVGEFIYHAGILSVITHDMADKIKDASSLKKILGSNLNVHASRDEADRMKERMDKYTSDPNNARLNPIDFNKAADDDISSMTIGCQLILSMVRLTTIFTVQELLFHLDKMTPKKVEIETGSQPKKKANGKKVKGAKRRAPAITLEYYETGNDELSLIADSILKASNAYPDYTSDSE